MADKFAEIASITSKRSDMLTEPAPIPFEERLCRLQNCNAQPIDTPQKISTKKELDEKLAILKKEYSPYLKNYAPVQKKYSHRIDLKHFKRNGKDVTIPEYGAPLGYAFTEYVTEVELENFDEKEVYIHFGAADYIATVYFNGECVGIHEGFFSPFEFNVTRAAKIGKNEIRVVLQNDFVFMGSSTTSDDSIEIQGDKLYAATGPGYDDPEVGWHHCPPATGLYNSVYIEIRNKLHLTDLYIRPLVSENEAEAWIEVESTEHANKEIEFELSLYGQNFEYIGFENVRYIPYLTLVNKTDSKKTIVNKLETDLPGSIPHAKFGKNVYKIRFKMDNYKLWQLSSPNLYQFQVTLKENNIICDTISQQFGMRDFVQDTESTLKGMFYLNNEKIRLRGANTMGFEQQDVMNGDIEQLIDDILYAKLCNMNFWRLTQRPVQDEIYEYCDKLGLLTQTDLPLFGVMRRSKVPEAIRQSEEMIRMVRKHPCNVVLSYINEPFPDGFDNPHRHLERSELERFFTACDMVLKINCPDCVIKHIEGDYDPPAIDTMPDNHCYTLWYNNHGLEFRKLHKGYWQKVPGGWYYGCGEYGAEGLDFKEIMENEYPKEWLREPFEPKNIIRAQSDNIQHWFFDRPDNLDEWISVTQEHQAFTAKYMTEAFRRDNRMISHAIHLFIDAWPSGWMKTIMDCKRNPKPAYFAYKNALQPVIVSLRSDRFTYFSGELAKIEAYICNDLPTPINHAKLIFELYDGENLMQNAEINVRCKESESEYCASAAFTVPDVDDRHKFTLKAILASDSGKVMDYNTWTFEAFADNEIKENDNVIFVTDLAVGEHMIAGEKVTVKECDTRNYVNARTGHRAVEEFMPNDFRFWYDKDEDMLSVMANKTFTADGFTPIICAWDIFDNTWQDAYVLAEKKVDGKTYIISTLNIKCENPVAKRLLRNLYKLGDNK